MNQEYQKIRKALYLQSPRFKQKQALVFVRFFLKLALFEALVVAFAVGSYFLSPFTVYAFIIIGIAAFGYLLKKSGLIGTRTFGTITDIKRITRGVDRNGGGVVRYSMDMMQKNFSVFTVTESNGKKREIELDTAFEKVFKKGDKLIRLTGMDYPVDLTPEELLICPFCGNIFPTENKVCIECNEPALNDTAIEKLIK